MEPRQTPLVERPIYRPVPLVCEICGFRQDMAASVRSWPTCPHCSEPLSRFKDDSRPVK